MKFRAVIFDLDGTLLDTLEDIVNSMNCVLTRLGFPAHPAEHYRRCIGNGLPALAERVLPDEHRDETTVQQCVFAMIEEYRRRWSEHTRPYPGIPELLDMITERTIPMAVLSNKLDDFTTEIVATVLGRWHFAKVIGAQPSLPQKPDPAGALLIAGSIGVEPEQCIYLGDSHTDMQTAVCAGMYPVGALWGFQTIDELVAAGARVLLKAPRELLALL